MSERAAPFSELSSIFTHVLAGDALSREPYETTGEAFFVDQVATRNVTIILPLFSNAIIGFRMYLIQKN